MIKFNVSVYTLSNIDYLDSDAYVFYSCYKLFNYMFKDNYGYDDEYVIFSDIEDLTNFIHNAKCVNEKL